MSENMKFPTFFVKFSGKTSWRNLRSVFKLLRHQEELIFINSTNIGTHPKHMLLILVILQLAQKIFCVSVYCQYFLGKNLRTPKFWDKINSNFVIESFEKTRTLQPIRSDIKLQIREAQRAWHKLSMEVKL